MEKYEFLGIKEYNGQDCHCRSRAVSELMIISHERNGLADIRNQAESSPFHSVVLTWKIKQISKRISGRHNIQTFSSTAIDLQTLRPIIISVAVLFGLLRSFAVISGSLQSPRAFLIPILLLLLLPGIPIVRWRLVCESSGYISTASASEPIMCAFEPELEIYQDMACSHWQPYSDSDPGMWLYKLVPKQFAPVLRKR